LDQPLSISERNRARGILKRLRETLPLREEDFAASKVAKETGDPFRVLVVTILTQNCTDVAALRAYARLDKRLGVTVPNLQKARVQTIESAIHVAGLHKQKARALRELANVIVEEYSGNFDAVLRGSFNEMRDRLQELPHVGPKTADVLLGIRGQPTISVDTHVDRVSKRLGLAPVKGRYEEVRSALMEAFRGENYGVIPMYFMALGRQVCKARRPLCPKCPVNDLCLYDSKTKPIRARH
jgi:endonuclease-3